MSTLDAARRAEHLRGIGRPDEAEAILRAALAEEPQDPTLLTALAAALLASRRHADGLAAAEAACASAPQDERPHRIRALHLSLLGRHDEALAAGYLAVTLAPDEPYAATGYARVLQRATRLRDAQEVAHRVVALDPTSAEAHFLLADIASDAGDRRTARTAYEETLRLDPEHAAATHDLAVLDARAHRPARALHGLIDAGRLDPAMPEVVQTVVAVLWQLSWRLRIWLIVATVATFAAAAPHGLGVPGANARIAAGAVLALTAALIRWTTRDLPRRTWPVVRAAVRTDKPLLLTYAALALCALLYVSVLASGIAVAAGAVWFVLVALGWLALVIRLVRSRRRGRT
ncbi:MAG: tetratricopeptide repeat protein [Pseudonocardia sp.]|nr:tetratricopeptide repeat protein [Pseudonocardia sp.]